MARHASPFVYGVYFLGPNFHWFFKFCKMQIKWVFGVLLNPISKLKFKKKKKKKKKKTCQILASN
jgi:hypothetical protein